MKIIFGINGVHKFKNAVVALGVFDGVHQGHRRIIKAVVRKARSIAGKAVVVTFWPHPQKEGSLFSLEHRLRLIAGLGVDACIVINFTKHFAGITADRFIREILTNKIGSRYIYVGRNFHFGKNAVGNYKTLQKYSAYYGYRLKIFEVIKIKNQAVSSTYIRSLIKKGNLGFAKDLLCHSVSVLGTVIRGTSLATKLGFPTANIDPHHEIIPPSGIYAVRVIFNHHRLSGVCYIGTRPTIQTRLTKTHIEVHIFDFSRNLYGKYMEVQFIKKIRDDKKFDSLTCLKKAIQKDVTKARRITST